MKTTHCANCGAALHDPRKTVLGVRDPALAKLDYDATQVVPMSDAFRQRMAELRARAVAQSGQHQPKPKASNAHTPNPEGAAP